MEVCVELGEEFEGVGWVVGGCGLVYGVERR